MKILTKNQIHRYKLWEKELDKVAKKYGASGKLLIKIMWDIQLIDELFNWKEYWEFSHHYIEINK